MRKKEKQDWPLEDRDDWKRVQMTGKQDWPLGGSDRWRRVHKKEKQDWPLEDRDDWKSVQMTGKQEREARLATRRQRRLEESADDRETRLATRRQRQMVESVQEREARLATRRQRRLEDSTEETEQRVVPSRHGHNLTTSRNNYLYEGGWLTDGPLHEQQWVNDIMIQFQKKQDKWKHIKCTICSEMWPIRFQSSQIETYTCIHCHEHGCLLSKFQGRLHLPIIVS